MARILTSIGITDIRQFGQIPQYEQLDTYHSYSGRPAYQTQDGTWAYTLGPSHRRAGAEVPVPGGKENVQTQYGYMDGGQFTPVDLAKVEFDNGVPITATGQSVYGNKFTNQAVPNTYSERQTGNAWGGTFAGKGNTGYRVQFTPDGMPIFYTSYASSNDLANLMQDLGPVGQIAIAVATGGLSIPQQIAAQMAIQILSGGDLEDAIKGAAISFAVSNIPGADFMKDGASYLNGIDSSGVLTRSFQTAATSATKAILTGQDISDALLSGAVSGGVSGAVDFMAKGIDGFDDLSKAEQAAAKTAIKGVISGKPLDQVLINSAISAANTQIKVEKDNKAAKDAGWADYATQQAAKLAYGPKITPEEYAGTPGISNRVVDETTPQGGVVQQLTDAGLEDDKVNLPSGTQLAGSNYQGEFQGFTYDPNYVGSDGSTGTYRPTETDEKTESTLDSLKNVTSETAAANTAPDWVKTSANEKVVGLEFGTDGEPRYQVERVNPNDPTQVFKYEVIKDAETGAVSYEYGGMSGDSMESVSARNPPPSPWDRAEDTAEQPFVGPMPEGSEQELTTEDLIKELGRTTEVPEFVDPFAATEAPFVGPRLPGESVGSEQEATGDPFGPLGTPTLEEIMSGSQPLTNTIPLAEELPAVKPTETTTTTGTTPPATGGEVVSVDPDTETALVVDGNGNVNVVDNTDGTLAPGDIIPSDATATLPIKTDTTLPADGTATLPTANITSEEVRTIVDDALKNNPSLTAEDVQEIVSDAVATIPNLTADQVREIVSEEVAKAPTGATPTDVENAIDSYMEANPGLSKADVTNAFEDYMEANPGLTIDEVATAIDAAVGDLATQSSFEKLQADLSEEIQAAKDIGLEGDAVLQAGLNSLSEKMGVDQADLLAQLGTTEENLRAEFATGISSLETQMQEQYNALTDAQKVTVDALEAQGTNLAEAIEIARTEAEEQLTGAETRLNDAIAAAEAAGLDRDEAITSAVESVASELGTTKEALLEQLGKTESELSAEIEAQGVEFGEQLGGVRDDVADLAAELGTTKDDLLEQLGYTEEELRDLIGAQGTEFGEQLGETETNLLERLGYTEDELRALIEGQGEAFGEQLGGVQDSVADLADDLGTTKDELLEQLGYTEEELRALIGDQGTELGKQIEEQGVNFGNMFTNFGNLFSKFQTDAQKQAADLTKQIADQRAADQQAAAESERRANIRATATQGAQQLQNIQQQLPQALKAAQQVSTPLYGTMEYFDPFGDPFAEKKMKMASSTNPADATKIASGGYIDDLLAEDLSVDDLMNLLR
jgi:hypothetical protein